MFFLYYSFAGGGLGRGWETRPCYGRFGCDFSIPDVFGVGMSTMKRGRGASMLKPVPDLPYYHV